MLVILILILHNIFFSHYFYKKKQLLYFYVLLLFYIKKVNINTFLYQIKDKIYNNRSNIRIKVYHDQRLHNDNDVKLF